MSKTPFNTQTGQPFQIGDIEMLPGMGRRAVPLDWFKRYGMDDLQVSRKSWIRSEPAHFSAHNGTYMRAYDNPNCVCLACNRKLGDIFGYDETTITVPTYEVVRIVSRIKEWDREKHAVYFCFDCAVNRTTMTDAIVKANHRGLLKTIATDGVDVYEFVATSIQEHRMYNQPPYEHVELRLLHGGAYGGGDNPDGRFHHVIGGRRLYHEYRATQREANSLARAMKRSEIAANKAAKDTAKDAAKSTAKGAKTAPAEQAPSDTKVAPKPRTRRASKYER